jgi:hypothetical protein
VQEPESVLVAIRPVPMHPDAWETAPAGVEVALRIAPDAARHGRPRLTAHQLADDATTDRMARDVDDVHIHTERGATQRARLELVSRTVRSAWLFVGPKLSFPRSRRGTPSRSADVSLDRYSGGVARRPRPSADPVPTRSRISRSYGSGQAAAIRSTSSGGMKTGWRRSRRGSFTLDRLAGFRTIAPSLTA